MTSVEVMNKNNYYFRQSTLYTILHYVLNKAG